MKDYLIIKTENKKEYIIIDQLNHNSITYFLAAEALNDEKNISDEFNIYAFNETTNALIELENEETIEIRELFNKRLESNHIEYDILENIDSEDFTDLKIIDIKDNLYILEFEGNKIEKYIEFFTNTKPKVNDTLYLSKKLLDINLLSYGYVEDLDKIGNEDILILKSNNYRVIYRRLYG